MHGLPEMIYIDNGKDWISRHIELVGLKFGIELHRHEPYHPQSKGKIERLFRTLEEMCIHPLDGSVGSNIQKRPRRVTPRLTLEKVRTKVERFIRDYHERIHGTTRQKPRERWENNLMNHRSVKDLADIDHLLKSKLYTVQKYGIHFQNDYYNDKEGVLGGYIGRRVTVFFDPRDTSCIRIWGRKTDDEEDHYLCTAYPQSSPENRVNRDTVAKHNKQRRDETRKNVREAQKEGEQALKVLDEMDAQEEAAEAAKAAPPTPEPPKPPSYVGTNRRPKSPVQHPHSRPIPSETDQDDEPDYDELRRIMQRKQRQGNQL